MVVFQEVNALAIQILQVTFKANRKGNSLGGIAGGCYNEAMKAEEQIRQLETENKSPREQ